MECIGIVELKELVGDNIFVKLKSEFEGVLKKKIRRFGISKLSKEIGTKKIINHWVSENSLIRLDVLFKVSNFFGLNFQDNIEFIRGRDGFVLRNPKQVFDFTTKSGVRIIAAILGDGCFDKRKRIFYANEDEKLINGFIQDVKNVFGDIEFDLRESKRKSSSINILTLPQFCGRIIRKVGIVPGKKVKTNPTVPKFIFQLPDENKWEFISQLFDDEGSANVKAKHLKIGFSVDGSYNKSNILNGIGELFSGFGIYFSIYECKLYSYSKHLDRKKFTLQINGMQQIKNMSKKFNLRSESKREKIKTLCNSYLQEQFQQRNIKEVYLTFMKQVQDKKGSFTSKDLSIATGRAIGSCRNTILTYKNQGLIKRIDSNFNYRVVE